MADEIKSVSPDTDANEFAKLNTELAATRTERDKLAERVARLEADAMNSRFAAEVEGTVSGGIRWFGDHEQHKTMLVKLAGAFGEQSPEVQQYIQQNRTYAAQLQESALLEELGSNHTRTDEPTALEALTAKAEEIHAANPKLTKEQAFANATEANPALYERYVREMRGGK